MTCWRRFWPPLAQFGNLPLHTALMVRAGPEVALALLHAYPDAASKPDKVRCGGDMGVTLWGCILALVCLLYVNVRTFRWFICVWCYICQYIHIHTYIYETIRMMWWFYIFIYLHSILHMHKNVYLHGFKNTQIGEFVFVGGCVRVRLVHTYVCAYVCVWVCVHAYVCAFLNE